MIKNPLHQSTRGDEDEFPIVIVDKNGTETPVTAYADLVGGSKYYAVVDRQGYEVPVGAYADLVGGSKYAAAVDRHEYESPGAGAYADLAGGSKYFAGKHGTAASSASIIYAVPMDEEDYSSVNKSHA